MIRLRDASVLAYTKLRLHRIRTGITVGIAGLLFGMLLVIVLVSQGVFNSLDSFGNTGLNSRYIVALSPSWGVMFEPHEHVTDKKFVAEVEKEHAAQVARKTAAAKKYSVPYDAKTEDPSPITTDPTTAKKMIDSAAIDSSEAVRVVVEKRIKRATKPFVVEDFIKKYPSAKAMGTANPLSPSDGMLTYMPDGKMPSANEAPQRDMAAFGMDSEPSLMVINASFAKPFITTNFDPARGEVPAIIPYKQAEKLLKLKPLLATATSQQKYDRLREVRRDVGKIKVAFCYRNAASEQLAVTATAQAAEIAQNKNNRDYTLPAVRYNLPSATSCATPKVVSDTRTVAQKKTEENFVLYQKAIGAHLGEPKQHKIVVRGVGIDSDYSGASSFSIEQLVSSLLSMPLGNGAWAVPEDMLASVPAKARPSAVFEPSTKDTQDVNYRLHLVEFTNKEEARSLLQSNGSFGDGMMAGNEQVFAMPYGSSSLLSDELKGWLTTIIVWTLMVVGVIASIVLTAVIGRTIADGRRESAVFRAIGARRIDIASIYGVYAFFLSLRIVVFAFVVGAALTLLVELLYWQDATLAARLAYAASDTAAEFHFFGLNSWYVLAIVGTIIAAALLASLIPILRNARRNPINDMRDE